MASINDLKNVLKETLEANGVMQQIRARIRAEIFNSLNDNPSDKPEITMGRLYLAIQIQIDKDNMIINDLIREYMEYNGFQNSLAVFGPESGMPEKQLDRQFITKKLKIVEDQKSKQMPLLYGLVFGMRKMISGQEVVQKGEQKKETNEQSYLDENKFPTSGDIFEKRDDFEFQGKKPMYQEIFKK